jgi:hypothetical protein
MEYRDYSNALTEAMSMPQTRCLTSDEFESLTKSLQLLRISQLRYIVQKFSIPASGNKTKLLNLVLSIFQSLRYDRVLIDILQEINKLLSQQRDAFTNPLASVGQLEVCQMDPNFYCPPNPLYSELKSQIFFGPIFAPEGHHTGQFRFCSTLGTNPVNICFLFPNGQVRKFGLSCEFNGYPFEGSIDDPFPQPIDVTHIINSRGIENVFNIRRVICEVAMMILICEYQYKGLGTVVNEICGREMRIGVDQIFVSSKSCEHDGSFALIPWLSEAYATGNWSCPICHCILEIENLKVDGSENIGMCDRLPDAVDQFGNGMGSGIFQPISDPFVSAFDWDSF